MVYQDVYFTDLGMTALMHAVRAKREDCVRMLLDAGADKEIKLNVRQM